MASGVGLHQDCLPVYQELKLGHKHKYIIYNLSQDLTQITVEKKDSDSEYDNFLTNLPENQCRWAVYDFEYKVDGAPRNKLVFFSWSPDSAKIKQKMLFASSKDALRRSLVGIGTEVQATDFAEVSHESVLEKVSRR